MVQTTQETIRRLDGLEQKQLEILKTQEKLETGQLSLKESINELNTTIALLNQTVELISKNEQKCKDTKEKGLLFILGSFVAAFVTWIVRGGLSQ